MNNDMQNKFESGLNRVKSVAGNMAKNPQSVKDYVRNKRVKIIGILLAVCMAFLLLSALTSSGGGSPEKVAVRFLTHVSKFEFDKMKPYFPEMLQQGWNIRMQMVHESLADRGLTVKKLQKRKRNITIKSRGVEIEDGVAEVTIFYSVKGVKDTGWVELEKERGKWKVTDLEGRMFSRFMDF